VLDGTDGGESSTSDGKLWVNWSLSRGLIGVGILMRRPDIFSEADLAATQNWLFNVVCRGSLTQTTSGVGLRELLTHTGNSNWQLGHINTRMLIAMVFTGTNRDTMIDRMVEYAAVCVPGNIYWDADAHHQLGTGYPKSANFPGNPSSDTAQSLGRKWGFRDVTAVGGGTPTASWFNGLLADANYDFGHAGMALSSLLSCVLTYHLNVGDFVTDIGLTDGWSRIYAMLDNLASIDTELIDEAWDPTGVSAGNGNLNTVGGTTWLPTGVGYGSINATTRDMWSYGGPGAGGTAHAPNFQTGDSGASASFDAALVGWHYFIKQVKGVGDSTAPFLQALVPRLLGTGTRTSTNAAGMNVLRQAYNSAWWGLMFNVDGPFDSGQINKALTPSAVTIDVEAPTPQVLIIPDVFKQMSDVNITVTAPSPVVTTDSATPPPFFTDTGEGISSGGMAGSNTDHLGDEPGIQTDDI
jgi:hypothetical protein